MLSVVLITSVLVLVLGVLIQVSLSECIKGTLYFPSCFSAIFLKDPEHFWPRSPVSIPYHISMAFEPCTYYAQHKFGIFIST